MSGFVNICNKKDADDRYFPPLIGNGDLSVTIDYEGNQPQVPKNFMTPGIFRAGKRFFMPGYPLINFGHVMQGGPWGELVDWRQTLNTGEAYILCERDYDTGIHAEMKVFCHAEQNIIAFRCSFSREIEYTFQYSIPYQRRLQLHPVSNCAIAYNADSMFDDSGMITLVAPEGANSFPRQDGLTFIAKGKSFDFFLVFDQQPEKLDFDDLLESHRQVWRRFWDEGYVRLPDIAVQRMYNTALYHLKVFSTKWSIPTGIFPLHWEGRYFGYDEMYCFDALLGGGHLELAKKIPDFRYSTLEQRLGYHKATCEKVGTAVSFPVETMENGLEGTPPGFWEGHIFQTANAGICAGWYVKYSGDMEYLKEKAYPLMRACSEYFRRGHIYKNGEKTIIGKCTDLERLGAFVENGLVTTCSVIALFRMTAEYAEKLNADAELAAELKKLAEELFDGLPSDGEKYIPAPGYGQRSIASYIGTYPYGVVMPDNPLQEAAISDADDHWDDFALQYASGRGNMSNWYKGIIANAYIRGGRFRDAAALISKASEVLGCFGECFEIYDWRYRPWFTTASGAIISAINSMLLLDGKFQEEVLSVWPDFEFCLMAPGGSRVRRKAVAGKMVETSE